jgi:hypothetical protein
MSKATNSVSPQDLRVGRRLPSSVGPSSVRVEVADQSKVTAAGVHGVVVSLTRADGTATAGRVHLRLDYSTFAEAYGGDWAGRLHLVELPACALTTPSKRECQTQTPLDSTNSGGAVSADVTVGAPSASGGLTVIAMDATASSQGGTFTATSLSPAYSWSAGIRVGRSVSRIR